MEEGRAYVVQDEGAGQSKAGSRVEGKKELDVTGWSWYWQACGVGRFVGLAKTW
jgi:hypothetical protein